MKHVLLCAAWIACFVPASCCSSSMFAHLPIDAVTSFTAPTFAMCSRFTRCSENAPTSAVPTSARLGCNAITIHCNKGTVHLSNTIRKVTSCAQGGHPELWEANIGIHCRLTGTAVSFYALTTCFQWRSVWPFFVTSPPTASKAAEPWRYINFVLYEYYLYCMPNTTDQISYS